MSAGRKVGSKDWRGESHQYTRAVQDPPWVVPGGFRLVDLPQDMLASTNPESHRWAEWAKQEPQRWAEFRRLGLEYDRGFQAPAGTQRPPTVDLLDRFLALEYGGPGEFLAFAGRFGPLHLEMPGGQPYGSSWSGPESVAYPEPLWAWLNFVTQAVALLRVARAV